MSAKHDPGSAANVVSKIHVSTSSTEIARFVGLQEETRTGCPEHLEILTHTSKREPSPMQMQRDPRRSNRIILSEQDARHIFQNKPPNGGRDRRRADMLASLYGVSVKTIRDIWVGRTWYRSTCHLDPSKPVNLHRLQRKPGRPLGAKDSKPRVVQPTRRDAYSLSPPLPLPYLSNDLAIVAISECCLPHPEAAALTDAWLQAPTPLADWLDGGGWAASAGWDDPFHDDWPFWSPDETSSDSASGSADSASGSAAAVGGP